MAEIQMRGVGFEPTNPYGIGASGLRLWPCLATPAYLACSLLFYFMAEIKSCLTGETVIKKKDGKMFLDYAKVFLYGC